MRIGLIAARQRLAEDESEFVGDISLGETTVLQRQMRQCLALECEKIICLADNLRPELIEIQREAEENGARFLLVLPQHSLVGAATADDKIFVINESVVCDNLHIIAIKDHQNYIATFPADVAVPIGYERIDKDLAFAGLMVLRGALFEKLSDLPMGADMVSALLRLALQSGGKTAPIPAEVLDNGSWRLVVDEGGAEEWRAQRLGQLITIAHPSSPAISLADRVSLYQAKEPVPLGGRLLIWQIITCLALFFGPGIVAFGQPVFGLFFLSIAAFSGRVSAQLACIIRDEDAPHSKAERNQFWLSLIIDITLFFQLGLAGLMAHQLVESLADMAFAIGGSLFVSAMVVGLMRMEAANAKGVFANFCTDRALIALILGVAGLTGHIAPFMQVFAVMMLAHLLWAIPAKK